jgi:hypothetical protein
VIQHLEEAALLGSALRVAAALVSQNSEVALCQPIQNLIQQGRGVGGRLGRARRLLEKHLQACDERWKRCQRSGVKRGSMPTDCHREAPKSLLRCRKGHDCGFVES